MLSFTQEVKVKAFNEAQAKEIKGYLEIFADKISYDNLKVLANAAKKPMVNNKIAMAKKFL